MADPRPEPAPLKRLALETAEPTAFGSGFISGLASAVLGIAGFGIVLALRFPEPSATPSSGRCDRWRICRPRST